MTVLIGTRAVGGCIKMSVERLVMARFGGSRKEYLLGDVSVTNRWTANQRLKLTGAAILVLRASTYLQAAPAA
jgi:hypothetical protein